MTELAQSQKISHYSPPLTRRQLLKSAAVSAVGIGAIGLAGVTEAKSTRGIVGQIAPALNVSHWIDGHGETTSPFSVAEHRGKWVYLKCFQDWCPACHSVGFPNLQKLKAAFPDDSKIVAAVIQTTFEGHSVNNAKALRKNQLRYNLNLPFGHDAGDSSFPHTAPGRFPSTMVSYRTGGTPWVTIIDPSGVVVYDGFHIDIDKLISHLQEHA